MIDALSKMYLRLVSCTLFSMNPEIHDFITTIKGSHAKTLENIELLLKYGVPFRNKNYFHKNG